VVVVVVVVDDDDEDEGAPVDPVVPPGGVLGVVLPSVVPPVEPVEPLGGGITGAVTIGPVGPVEPVEPELGEAGAVVVVPLVSVGLESTVGSVWDCDRPGSGVEVVPVVPVVPVLVLFTGVFVAGVTGVLFVEASSSGLDELCFLIAVFCLCFCLVELRALWC
jgi:hypothetical protein